MISYESKRSTRESVCSCKKGKVLNIWNSQWIGVNDIEYTRTDAFIEKAAKWLNNFYNEDTHSYLIDEDIEKFVNYIKEE